MTKKILGYNILGQPMFEQADGTVSTARTLTAVEKRDIRYREEMRRFEWPGDEHFFAPLASERLIEIYRGVEAAHPGGGWKMQWVVTMKGGQGIPANCYYPPNDGPATAVFADGSSSTDWEA